MQYLEFEQPIEQLNNKLIKAKELASKKNMNTSKKIIDIENQIQEAKKNIYNKYRDISFGIPSVFEKYRSLKKKTKFLSKHLNFPKKRKCAGCKSEHFCF